MLRDAQKYLTQAPRLAVYPGDRDRCRCAGLQSPRRWAARRARSADDDADARAAAGRRPISPSGSTPRTARSTPSTSSPTRWRRARSSASSGSRGAASRSRRCRSSGLLPRHARSSRAACSSPASTCCNCPRSSCAGRGSQIAFVFQEPMTSLNPVYTVGRQIGEVLRAHLGLSRREAARPRDRAAAARPRPGARATGGRVPAPALGRHAAARDDRDGDRLRPEVADRRRADDGARRDHPGRRSSI